jgi:formylglycine-generating enzyme required for sulfatase activity
MCGQNVSCCLSYPVYGGSFDRSCDSHCSCEDGPYPANVASFWLDAFEVTVGRFRQFVEQYATALPATASGKNQHNSQDEGWRAEWNDLLPSTREDLIALITSADCYEPRSWDQADDTLPMNCVTWHVAQAFCVWDGGRLPTQTEWNYAATGGDEQRRYPWSSPPDSTVIDGSYAVYAGADPAPEGPARVGTHRPGAGRWGQEDLSGNVAEWVFDDHQDCYATPDSCDNCGVASPANVQKTVRGGGFWEDTQDVTAARRTWTAGGVTNNDLGFRCARDL